MAEVFLISGEAAPAIIGPLETRFLAVANSRALDVTVETHARITYRSSGMLSGLYCKVVTNDRENSTLRSRINGANGNQAISIGASTTGEFTDTINTDTIAVADGVNASIVTGSGGTNITIGAVGAAYLAPTNMVSRIAGIGLLSHTIDNATRYQSPVGSVSVSGAESNRQIKIKGNGTLQNLFYFISSNARTTSTTTLRLRKNESNGNQSISVGAGSTGTFEDTGNIDSVVANDRISMDVTTGSGLGEEITIRVYGVEFVTLNKTTIYAVGGQSRAIFSNTSAYFNYNGNMLENISEGEVQIKATLSFVTSGLGCRINANSLTDSSTIRNRINGVNGNQVLSIPSLTTGFFDDTINSDIIDTGDLINYSIITGINGTSLNITYIGLLANFSITPKGEDFFVLSGFMSDWGLEESLLVSRKNLNG